MAIIGPIWIEIIHHFCSIVHFAFFSTNFLEHLISFQWERKKAFVTPFLQFRIIFWIQKIHWPGISSYSLSQRCLNTNYFHGARNNEWNPTGSNNFLLVEFVFFSWSAKITIFFYLQIYLDHFTNYDNDSVCAQPFRFTLLAIIFDSLNYTFEFGQTKKMPKKMHLEKSISGNLSFNLRTAFSLLFLAIRKKHCK